MLTKKQKDLLLFIHHRLSNGEIAPSFDEMKDALELKSKSGIHRLISALVERGFLERLPNKARALQVKRLPDGYTPEQDDHTDAAKKARIVQDLNRFTPPPAMIGGIEGAGAAQSLAIPLYGKIAAGTAIEAIRHEGQNVDVPATMLPLGDHYALQVEGDSMQEAGIMDNDIVLIKKSEQAKDGDIIVALVDQQEATLKRLRRRGGHVDLIPENRNYEIKTFDASRVAIQGVLSGLYRTY